MSLPTQSTISDVQEIWKYANKIYQVTKITLEQGIKDFLTIYDKELPSDFENEQYCFPSKITENFARDYVQFPTEKRLFALRKLVDAITANNVNNDSIHAIIIMLNDVALFRAYSIIKELSDGRLFYQLNGCIILDAMVIKPDKIFGYNYNISSVLDEVSKKAIICIESLDKERLWSLAMLNYKVHHYKPSIVFFKRYIDNYQGIPKDSERIIKAKIYIGYCHEKSEEFDDAIKLFEDTLQELKNSSSPYTQDDNKIIRELNHGLGHFYNERAVFSRNGKQTRDSKELERKSSDLIAARKRMQAALEEKPDYYSCYGSLYHEYGDYPTAQVIFDKASEKDDIKCNDELHSELEFYIAQTKASRAKDKDEQIKQAEDIFKAFEDYCKKTYNYDGIVHARVFKIRTYLRSIGFISDTRGHRGDTLGRIKDWQEELTQYSLSSYASESIKKEYDKVLCILKIYRLLYSDDSFEWYTADLLRYLHDFMEFMPEDALKLDYKASNKKETATNLYQISLDGLWFWCVSSSSLECDTIRCLLLESGITPEMLLVGEEEKETAHRRISQNSKPDLVVLLPPTEKDFEFEREFEAIKSSVHEQYFIYCPRESSIYNDKWFKDNITNNGKNYTYHSARNETDALLCAYCLRAFEVLRKELLNPIPLFSLAPTHFSASYDYQLGESLGLCVDNIVDRKRDSRSLMLSLQFIDNKYTNNWLDKQHEEMEETIDKGICVDGEVTICCPVPMAEHGMDYFIGYWVKYGIDTCKYNFSDYVGAGESYTIKALPSYEKDCRALGYALDIEGKSCENGKSLACRIYEGESFQKDNDQDSIAKICRSILRGVFNVDAKYGNGFDRPFTCIKKTMDNSDGSPKRSYIYIILKSEKGKEEIGEEEQYVCCYEEGSTMAKKRITVFVTYAWDALDAQNNHEYLKEVTRFVNALRKDGYDATYDRELYLKSHDWHMVMNEGLQMDKVIVLLSKNYKKKADDIKSQHGVTLERNAIINIRNQNPEKVICAKLPSQSSVDVNEICPVLFSGQNIIDLSSQDKADGYNFLLRTLAGKSIAGDLVDVSDDINEGKTI